MNKTKTLFSIGSLIITVTSIIMTLIFYNELESVTERQFSDFKEASNTLIKDIESYKSSLRDLSQINDYDSTAVRPFINHSLKSINRSYEESLGLYLNVSTKEKSQKYKREFQELWMVLTDVINKNNKITEDLDKHIKDLSDEFKSFKSYNKDL